MFNIPEALLLSSIKGIGNKTLFTILNGMQQLKLDSIEELSLHKNLLHPVFKSAHKKLSAYFESHDLREDMDAQHRLLKSLEAQGITVISYFDSQYPNQLKRLNDAPVLLFCKGNISLLTEPKPVAVIGTRDNTPIGALITRRTVQFLSNSDACIVSGLASGIDYIAHEMALSLNAPIVAVVVDVSDVQPKSSQGLADAILANNGLLIAENLPGVPFSKGLLVQRDRIQAGLAIAIFAVETTSTGGTLHATKVGFEIGALVYAPAPEGAYKDLSIPQIEGTQHLIQSSIAKPYTKSSYEDIALELDNLRTTSS